MAKGEICCCGSSLFLKRLYGVGYSFTISVNADIDVNTVRDEINDVVMNKIHSAQLLSLHGAELIYRLPFESSKTFPELFRLIDERKTDLHIDSYGISVTTLEEVFIKVGHGETTLSDMTEEVRDFKETLRERRESSDGTLSLDAKDKVKVVQVAVKSDKENEIINRDEVEMKYMDENEQIERQQSQWDEFLEQVRHRSQKNLFFVHVYAMLYKKFHYTKRDKRVKFQLFFFNDK